MAELVLPRADATLRARLILLTGQAFCFGLTLALLIVVASALFLTTFGPARLPYTYITVAVLGALISAGLANLQRRWSLPRLAMLTTGVLAGLFLLAWLALTLAHANWLSFLLLVLFALFLQIGFVFIGGQAGRLFDVRQIKRLFPRIVSGFAIGFMLGGLSAAPLLRWLGQTADLLLVATGTDLLLLLLLLITSRRFAQELNQTEQSQNAVRQPKRQSLGRLLTKPFVLLIFLYQMLSALVTQLIDFMLFERAVIHYTNSEVLAQFVGNFTALLNLADILFLALAAGFLLSRFGLRFGLTANPAGVVFFLVALSVSGYLVGPTSLLFFVFVGAARIADIALTDGTTRTSINAAYQVLPVAEQLAVQTGVEGIGVPLALGLTGVILLLFQTLPGLNILHLVLLTLGLTVAWIIAGLLVYRGYATNLLRGLQGHTLVEAELSLADGSALAVVERLARSEQLSDVRLGLDLLQGVDHPRLAVHLVALAAHANPALQAEALSRIEQRQLQAALPQVEATLATASDPLLKGQALRALAALRGTASVAHIQPYLADADPEIRLAALVGLLRHGGIPGVLAAGERLTALQHAPEPAARALAAQVIGQVGIQHFYQPLQKLLQDEAITVRQAALQAAGQVGHPDLLPLIIENLENPRLRSEAINSLTAYGAAILPWGARALTGEFATSRATVIDLLQLCGALRGEKVIVLLQQALEQPDREVGYYALVALQSVGYRAHGVAGEHWLTILQRDAEHGARILVAQQELGPANGLEPLQRALSDEFALLQRRVFRLLALRYDAQAILRAEQQLSQASENGQALALEMLEVTLTGVEKAAAMPLLNPKLTADQRLTQLTKDNTIPNLSREQQLIELIADPQGRWLPGWLRACAIYAAGRLPSPACADAIALLSDHPDPILRETVAWALPKVRR